MKTSTKFLLTAAFVGTLGLGGLARTVYASQSKPTVAIMPQHQSNAQIAEASDGDGEVPDATEAPEAKRSQLSVTNKTQVSQRKASDTDSEQAQKERELQEIIRLQPLAKINIQQAVQAAEAVNGGKTISAELENDDGNLVYKVTIAEKEISVDAGNGKVLYTENVNQPDNEAAEANRPKSSIQVPNNEQGERQGRQQLPRVR